MKNKFIFSMTFTLISCSDLQFPQQGTLSEDTTKASWDCPVGTTATNSIWQGKKTCSLEGRYVNDLVLTNDYSYYLKGGVFIGNDNKSNARLTIEPGTFIVGATGADFLVITRGSQIHAVGTATQPIVFTTHINPPKRGSWGGLIINGNAPVNCRSQNTQGFCEAEGEGSTGFYGGKDKMDSSGILKYVRVEWAGFEITPDNELNGIAFQGVGAGTLVDFIQVHKNADDGIEFFGGTVNVKHIYLTSNKDDSIDWTSGWTGNAQFVLVKQDNNEGNNGIEADNLKSPMDAQPRSNPTIANITLLGSVTARKGGVGILLRRGTGLKLYNAIIKGFKIGGIDINDDETFKNADVYTDEFPGIHIANTIFDNEQNFVKEEVEEDIESRILHDMDMEVLFGLEPAKTGKIVFEANLPIQTDIEMKAVTPENKEGFFEEVDYIGALDPEGTDWTVGWTKI